MAGPTLPAGSVAVADVVHCPSASGPRSQPVAAPTTKVQVTGVPPPAGVAVTVIVSPVVPPGTSMRGVESPVRLSVEDEPVSDALARSGAPGALGATVSIEIGSAGEALEVLPAGSVRVELTFQVPSLSVPRSQLAAGTTYVHVTVLAPFVAVMVTVSPLEPPAALIVGVLSLVTLSVAEEPRSDALARSTPVGALGAVESIETGSESVVPVLPARSVIDAEIVHAPSPRVPRVQFVLAPTV